ncbi:MAG: tRNA uridine-5-carboxymethylaminomethyl(34) synthesis GTPase MnmE [Verrucomicrobiota bacterium]|nr:tRNA uridine-5-carboxymethylaminomethyl(34) synthesis GTPase MnmE [Verrucomicrobiota bacterium]
MSHKDPIAAIATPAGEGAVALIRLSGEGVFAIGDRVLDRPISSHTGHTVHYRKLVDAMGNSIDQVLIIIMRTPRSYTGQDTLEISCHGGALIARRILERLYEAGARPAQPGEFSLRAFLNGKIDLAQAEAVQKVIAAKGEEALKQASRQLEGKLSQKIQLLQKELIDTAAILEASVDFPEEGLAFEERLAIEKRLKKTCLEMRRLTSTFSEGRVVEEGVSLCLLGAPNVGKSSLMNALLGYSRAIVTEIAGTTRDLLQEPFRLGGLHFRLIDTAGIRDTEEKVEQEGIRRSQEAMEKADLVLLLLDASRPMEESDWELLEKSAEKKRLVVWNKMDVGAIDSSISSLAISATEGSGLEKLQQAIVEKVWNDGALPQGEVLITNLRHYRALVQALQSAERSLEEVRNEAFPELIVVGVREALQELGTILGIHITEEILSAIFSKFCLGK